LVNEAVTDNKMNEVIKNELAENEKQRSGKSEKVKMNKNGSQESSVQEEESHATNGVAPASNSTDTSGEITDISSEAVATSTDEETNSAENTTMETREAPTAEVINESEHTEHVEIPGENHSAFSSDDAIKDMVDEEEIKEVLDETASKEITAEAETSEKNDSKITAEAETVAADIKAVEETAAPEMTSQNEVKEEAETVQAPVSESSTSANLQLSDNDIIADDSAHDDKDLVEPHEDFEAEAINYSNLNKEQLVELAVQASHLEDLKEASDTIKAIRPVFEEIIHSEFQAALEKFIEEGNIKEDFAPRPDPLKEKFQLAYKTLQGRKVEYRAKVEDERQKNLAAKKLILQKLKNLTEADETRESLNEVKSLQNEWKRIKAVPKEDVQELWDNYRFYLDKFYDNLSINNELKELDRRKNLEYKIELCKKVDALSEEKSIKKAMILLNKYHDEWKNTGPVPKEFSEEMWSRFKEASDKIYAQKKAVLDEMHKEWNQNLENKVSICEKVEALSNFEGKNPKMWIEKTKEINTLLDEWKKVGPVSRAASQQVWNRFREASNNFYNKKNVFFKSLNHEKNLNLKIKTELCEKAEALQESVDWGHATDEIKQLQEQWKKSGAVPEKQSDKIWKRFRASCDHFFHRKAQRYASQEQEYTQNLEVKSSICEKLETLQQQPESENLYNELKPLQEQWLNTGFVPMNKKEEINKRYNDALNRIYNTLRSGKSNFEELKQRSHFEAVAHMPNGKVKLNQEERTIADKLRLLKGEVSTWENNIEFFRNSKNADVLKKQIEDKISSAQAQIVKLEERLKIIKSVK